MFAVVSLKLLMTVFIHLCCLTSVESVLRFKLKQNIQHD